MNNLPKGLIKKYKIVVTMVRVNDYEDEPVSTETIYRWGRSEIEVKNRLINYCGYKNDIICNNRYEYRFEFTDITEETIKKDDKKPVQLNLFDFDFSK